MYLYLHVAQLDVCCIQSPLTDLLHLVSKEQYASLRDTQSEVAWQHAPLLYDSLSSMFTNHPLAFDDWHLMTILNSAWHMILPHHFSVDYLRLHRARP